MKNQIKSLLLGLLLVLSFNSVSSQEVVGNTGGLKVDFMTEGIVSDSVLVRGADKILKYVKKSDLLSSYAKTSEVNTLDAQNVKITGNQSIEGEKNFENIKITNQVPTIDFYSTNEELAAKIEYNGSGEVFDFSDDIFLRGSLYLFGDSQKITNIQSVTSDTDAANKIYVDNKDSERKTYVDNLDSQNVKLTGDQSKSGKMTFTDEAIFESAYSLIRLKEAGVNKGAIGRNFAGQSATSKGMWFTNATNRGLWLSETDNKLYYRDTFDQFLLLNENNFGKQEIEGFGFADGPHISDNSQIANGEGYTTNTGTTTSDNTQTFTNKTGSNSQWTNDENYSTNSDDAQNVKITGDQDVAGVKNFTNFLRTRNLVINGTSGGYSSGDNPMFAFGNNPTSGGFGVVEMPFGEALKFTSYHGYKFDVSNGTGSGVNALDISLNGVADFKFNVKAPSLDVSGDLTAVNGDFSEALTLTDESFSIAIGTDALTKFIIRNAGPSTIIKSLKDNFYIQANGSDSNLRIEAQKSIYISSGGVLSMAITPAAGVNLRYNGDSRFTTTSSGGTLIGTLKTDNATITDGSLILQGTGRLQGIDVVTASTDAVSKAYVDNIGTPAILSNGTLPSLNSGIIGSEVRDLIGAGTVRDVRAGSGMTQTGDPEEDTVINVIGTNGIVANADSIEVDDTVVRTSGNQTLDGVKTFTNNVKIEVLSSTEGNKIVVANTNGTLSTRAGYKVYIAKVSQFFTNNVSDVVLENTFSSVPTWSRSGVGVYKLNSSTSEFTGNKTTYSINQSAGDAFIVISKGTAVTDEIIFRTRNIDTNALQDASILNATIEVRVYN